MTTIDERIKCEKCGENTAVLEGVLRLEDRDGPIDPDPKLRSCIVYLNEKLRLSYYCRVCGHKSEKTIRDLPKA